MLRAIDLAQFFTRNDPFGDKYIRAFSAFGQWILARFVTLMPYVWASMLARIELKRDVSRGETISRLVR